MLHIGRARSADSITIVHSGARPCDDLFGPTKRRFRAQPIALADSGTLAGCAGRMIVIDADLNAPDTVRRLRHLLSSAADKPLLFVVDRSDRGQYVQACALGADRVLARPLEEAPYIRAIEHLLGIEAAAPIENGVKAGVDALRTVFALADGRADVSAETIAESAAEVVVAISEGGLRRWIDAVQQHHNATYQHCLLVTGTAVAFGQHLGFRKSDIDRLLVGGLVHDLGKVAVPVAVLEKPGPLDPGEVALMKTHPTIGRDMLEENGGFSPEMIDVVAQHHEYLDGSGYPEGRAAPAISDLVRVITIADIFSALVERRAYRAAMSPAEAYDVLRSMTGRLDMALVRAFEPITREHRKAAA